MSEWYSNCYAFRVIRIPAESKEEQVRHRGEAPVSLSKWQRKASEFEQNKRRLTGHPLFCFVAEMGVGK